MKHLFVPYELALKLKEKGFNEQCLMVYESKDSLIPESEAGSNYTNVDAPLYQQVQYWFREKHNISIELHWQQGSQGWSYCYGYNAGDWFFPKETYKYYEALTKAIEEAIKLI